MVRRSAKSRIMMLLSRLERIKSAVHSVDVEDAMVEFTYDMLQLHVLKGMAQLHHNAPVFVFNKGDETLLSDLARHGAISVLLTTMCRFMGKASPEFFNSATISLVHLCFQNEQRSNEMYRLGAVRTIVDMMESYRDVDYIQIIGITALMVMGKTIGLNSFHLESLILEQIVSAMEYHQETSSRVYVVACSALGTLFGPTSTVIVNAGVHENIIYHRALCAITYGLILHLDDQLAHGVGHALLCNMVGPDVAEELIAEVESNHGVVYCAAAA